MLNLATGKAFTRRESIKGLAAILAAGCAPSIAKAAGGLVRGAAARAGFLAGFQLSAHRYIKDGLVAMWDGIENAGFYKHDSNATVWKDLVGSRDWALTSNATVNDDNLGMSGCGAYQSMLPKVYTIELVSKTTSGRCILNGYGPSNNMIQGVVTVAGLTGYQVSFTYPQSSTKWISTTPTVMNSITVTYEDYNDVSTATKDRYVNGVEQTDAYSGNNHWGNGGSSYLGSISLTDASWPWVGNIYSLRLYSKVLSVAEVLHNNAVDHVRFGVPLCTD